MSARPDAGRLGLHQRRRMPSALRAFVKLDGVVPGSGPAACFGLLGSNLNVVPPDSIGPFPVGPESL